MSASLNIALAQLNPIVGDLRYNTDKILSAWRDAPAETDLIAFPELIICGYPPEDLVLKPFFIKQVESAIEKILKESKDYSAAALIGCPWQADGKIYNAVHLIEHGEIKASITKCHLPNYGVFDEQRIFESGDLPFPVNFRGAKLGIMICEDMWFPDIAAHLKHQGAENLIVINASPYDSNKDDTRLGHARARVKQTSLPLYYVNQVGGQDELVFDGSSFVLSAEGEILAQAPDFKEGVYTAQSITPNLKGHEEIYQALVLGLRDYINKNNFPGVLIGLSGGIDSALSAAIAVDALGADKVRGVMMPSKFTSKDSLEDAEELAKNLGIKLDSISIEEPVASFDKILAPHLGDNPPSTTFENIQPRSRGLILMALSNATGYMLLSTGNKSEMAVGYATLYGDMNGGFNALKDVYKTQVYELARWRNTQGAVIPERSITKAPTAELKENQTDQDTLPEYEELDDILTCLIEHDMAIDEITERGHSRETVAKVWTMLDRAEYKRRQAAPGIKITARSFGRDRRYPITNHFVNIIEKDSA